jgi:hypothetical protein
MTNAPRTTADMTGVVAQSRENIKQVLRTAAALRAERTSTKRETEASASRSINNLGRLQDPHSRKYADSSASAERTSAAGEREAKSEQHQHHIKLQDQF